MTNLTKDKLNKKLAEKMGVEWHEYTGKRNVDIDHVRFGGGGFCSCGKYLHGGLFEFNYKHEKLNPDYTTDAGKVELLRVIAAKKPHDNDGCSMFKFLCYLEDLNSGNGEYSEAEWLVEKYLLDTTGALAEGGAGVFGA